MHFGLEIVPFGYYADPRNVLEIARVAEDAGWEGIWLWDHMLMPFGVGDLWVMFAAIAAATQRLKLVSGVAALPRYRPETLARLLNGLDLLSGGRLILGAGAGAIAGEFTAFGGPAEAKTRAEMLDESLEILNRLWTGEAVDFKGKHYTVSGAALLPAPVQKPRIPVWIGGDSQAAKRRAACWDGWIMGTIDERCEYTLSVEQLAGKIASIQPRGSAGSPFDIAVDGISEPGQASRVKDYAEIGVTWWFEGIFTLRAEPDELMKRVKAGPPA